MRLSVLFSGECVVLDADTYNLNFVKCYATSGCPPKAYISFDLYQCKLLLVVIILEKIVKNHKSGMM